jgi:hypothetical protein
MYIYIITWWWKALPVGGTVRYKVGPYLNPPQPGKTRPKRLLFWPMVDFVPVLVQYVRIDTVSLVSVVTYWSLYLTVRTGARSYSSREYCSAYCTVQQRTTMITNYYEVYGTKVQ